MWRLLTRPLRSILTESNYLKYAKNTSPVLTDQTLRKYNEKCCCGKSSNGKGRYGQGQRADQDPYHQAQPKHDWTEALGWSGVFLLCWYLSHPCWHRRILSKEQRKGRPANYCQVFTRMLTTPVGYVLPIADATKTEREETLAEGLKRLEIAHEQVTSSLTNWLGMESMQAGRYTDAFDYFKKAAKDENPAALFNLGICHEMGLGTEQDFRKAAQFYKKASHLGHATAMYNLGVFYVHGWGGIPEDVEEAQRWFEKAAELGQLEAKQLLNGDPDQEEKRKSYVVSGEPEDNDDTELWFQSLNISVPSLEVSQDKATRLTSIDSGVGDLSPTLSELVDVQFR